MLTAHTQPWCWGCLQFIVVSTQCEAAHDHDADFDNGNADTHGVDFADDDFAENFYTNDDDLADYFDFADYFDTDDSDFNDSHGFDFDEDTKSEMKCLERFWEVAKMMCLEKWYDMFMWSVLCLERCSF